MASFKYYKVMPIEPRKFDIYDCTRFTRSTNKYHILDAKHGGFPQDSFCRAISKEIIPGNNYYISAEMFMQGWRNAESGRSFVGLAFNAKDSSNYDFLYVRCVVFTLMLHLTILCGIYFESCSVYTLFRNNLEYFM